MAVKTYQLISLQEQGVFWQDKDGCWYTGFREDVDLTPYLYKAGMFEH